MFAVIGIGVVVGSAFTASQVEQRLFRRRAERLSAEIQSLELRITPWHDVRGQFQHWATNEFYDSECNEQQCSLEIALAEPVYEFISKSLLFVHLDDYLRWRLKLTYETGPFVRIETALLRAYLIMGGRPAKVVAKVGIRNGIISGKGFQTSTVRWRVDEFIRVVSNVESIPELDSARYPQVTLHPTYLIYRQSGCCDDVWNVLFTPQADPNDIRRLTQFNLSCLTRIRPCENPREFLPAAWKQYLSDQNDREPLPRL